MRRGTLSVLGGHVHRTSTFHHELAVAPDLPLVERDGDIGVFDVETNEFRDGPIYYAWQD